MGDTETIQRFEITPEWIKNASDDEILEKLKQLRGNREVMQAKATRKANGGTSASKSKAPKIDPNDDEEVGI